MYVSCNVWMQYNKLHLSFISNVCTATIYVYIFQEVENDDDDDRWTEFREVEVEWNHMSLKDKKSSLRKLFDENFCSQLQPDQQLASTSQPFASANQLSESISQPLALTPSSTSQQSHHLHH